MGGLESNGEPWKVMGGACARLSGAHSEHSSDLIIQSDLKTSLTNEPGPTCLLGGFLPSFGTSTPHTLPGSGREKGDLSGKDNGFCPAFDTKIDFEKHG